MAESGLWCHLDVWRQILKGALVGYLCDLRLGAASCLRHVRAPQEVDIADNVPPNHGSLADRQPQ